MHSVDADTAATINRYRAAYDKADGADEEEPGSYEEVAAWMLSDFLKLARVAWAVANPLQPLSAEILIEAGQDGVEQLHEILPELRRFGEAILTQGDPSRLDELIGLDERERRQRELFEEAMRGAASKDAVADARYFASVFENLLRLLDANQRRTILAEFEAALAR
jgi:hypothetical protein